MATCPIFWTDKKGETGRWCARPPPDPNPDPLGRCRGHARRDVRPTPPARLSPLCAWLDCERPHVREVVDPVTSSTKRMCASHAAAWESRFPDISPMPPPEVPDIDSDAFRAGRAVWNGTV